MKAFSPLNCEHMQLCTSVRACVCAYTLSHVCVCVGECLCMWGKYAFLNVFAWYIYSMMIFALPIVNYLLALLFLQ